ncbi:MAG: hypothetical protein KatS3mg109_1272 [Pirellulaceae bacterium]|nr:MAG: hypothetical protein KatS3mg109_1272 [Pirellulaceae bacterium]
MPTTRNSSAWWSTVWLGLVLGLMASLAGQQTDTSDPKAIQLYQTASNLFQNQQYDLALEEYQRLVTQFPKDPLVPRARYQAALCRLQLQQWQAAADELEGLLKDVPGFELRQEALLNLGWCRFREAETAADPETRRKSAQAAVGTFKKLLTDFPEGRYTDQVYFFLGESHQLLNQWSEAEKVYRRLLDEHPDSPLVADTLYGLAQTHRSQGHWPQALEVLESFLGKFADHELKTEVLFAKAECLVQLGRLEEAEPLLGELAKGKPPLADQAKRYLGYCLERRGQDDQAAALYEQLAQATTDRRLAADALLAAGRIRFRQEKWPQARSCFEQASERLPELRWEAGHWWVQVAMKQQDIPAAEKRVHELLKDVPPGPLAVRLTMDLGDVLAAQPDRAEEAIAAYERVVQQAPQDPVAPQALYAAALVAWRLRQFDRAVALAKRIRGEYATDPLVAEARRLLAEHHVVLQQYDAAADEFTRLIAEYPDHPDRAAWRLRLATVYSLQKQYDRVVSYLADLADSWPSPALHVEATILQAQALYQLNKLETALDLVTKVYDKYADAPRAEELLLWQARCYQKQQRYDEAISLLTTISEKFSKSPVLDQVFYRLGECYQAKADYQNALAAYERVLAQASPSNFRPFALLGRGWCLYHSQKYGEAIGEATRLLEEFPQHELVMDAVYLRGIARRLARQYDDAIQDLQRVAENTSDPVRRGDALLEWALALNDSGKPELARDRLLELLASLPDYPRRDQAVYDLAWTYRTLKDEKAALEQFQKLVEQYPNSVLVPEALFHIAENAYQQNNFDLAIEIYQQAQNNARNELREKILYKLGFSYYQKKDFSNSLETFRQQAREFPEGSLAGDAVFMQGESLFRQEKYREALPLFEQADKMDLSSDTMRRLLWLHAGQVANQLQQWDSALAWLSKLADAGVGEPLHAEAAVERALAFYRLRRLADAAKELRAVVEQQSVLGLRARFLSGEVLFAEGKLDEAHREFRKAMYGYGGTNPPDEFLPWLAKAGIEAGRCAELMLEKATQPDAKSQALEEARKAYRYVIDRCPQTEEARAAAKRLNDLNQLRF